MSDASSIALIAITVRLVAQGAGTLLAGAPMPAYAAVLKAVERSDPQASAEAHGVRGVHKRALLTCSGLMRPGAAPMTTLTVQPGEIVEVRVSAVGERVVAALIDALRRPDLTLDVCGTPFTVLDARLEHAAAPNPCSWQQILEAAAERQRTVLMHFESPTTFERKGLWLALPSPDTLFGKAGNGSSVGLAGRWAALGGPDEALGPFDGARLGARIVRIQPTRAVAMLGDGARHAMDAFVGSVEFSARLDQAFAMQALALFAQFSGVGQRVSMGFGRVSVDVGRP